MTQGWRDFAARDTFLHRFWAPRPDPRDTVTAFIDSLTAETAAAGPTLCRGLEPIGYVPPAEYEARYYKQAAVA